MSQQHPRALGTRSLLVIVAAAIAATKILRAAVSVVAVDLAALAGAAFIVHGISLWSVPAAWITAGLFLLVGAVRSSRVDGK